MHIDSYDVVVQLLVMMLLYWKLIYSLLDRLLLLMLMSKMPTSFSICCYTAADLSRARLYPKSRAPASCISSI